MVLLIRLDSKKNASARIDPERRYLISKVGQYYNILMTFWTMHLCGAPEHSRGLAHVNVVDTLIEIQAYSKSFILAMSHIRCGKCIYIGSIITGHHHG